MECKSLFLATSFLGLALVTPVFAGQQYQRLTSENYAALQQMMRDPNPTDDQPVKVSEGDVSGLLGSGNCSGGSNKTCTWSEGSRKVTVSWSNGVVRNWSGSGF